VVDVYLSDGRIWYFQEYLGEEYDSTVAFEDRSRPQRNNPSVREKASADVDPPYLGDMGEFALSTGMPHGTVVTRDRIVAEDYETGGGFFGSGGSELDDARPEEFEKAFRKKYRAYKDTNLAFVNGNSGLFSRNTIRPDSVFNSADLMVFAYTGSIDDSYRRTEEVRREVVSDLESMAEKLLED